MNCESKPLALDGRLRAVPATDNSRYLNLFFMVTRTNDPEKANLCMHYVEMKATVDIDLNLPVGKKRTFTIAAKESELPQLPVLYNPTQIKKHTRLIVQEDVGLADILEKQKATKLQSTSTALKAGLKKLKLDKPSGSKDKK